MFVRGFRPGTGINLGWGYAPGNDGDPAGGAGSDGQQQGGGSGGQGGDGNTGGSSGNRNGGSDGGDNPNDPLKERIDRARRQGERAAEERIRQERDADLAKRNEFETLANTRQQTIDSMTGRVRELESTIERLEAQVADANKAKEAAEAALQDSVKEQLKDVPEHVSLLVQRLPVTEQLTYLAKHKDDLTKPRHSAVPANPGADGGNARPGDDDALSAYLTGRYSTPK